MASKIESEDYPSFKEIMRMSPKERAKWLDSMDEEIQALLKTGACEFADHADVLKERKEIVKSTWAFRKKRKPSGEVTRSRVGSVFVAISKRQLVLMIATKRLLLWLNG